MFYIQIAELKIGIDNRFEYVASLCRDYFDNSNRELDFTVRCSDEMLQNEMNGYAFPVSPAHAESVCIYREICTRLVDCDAFVIHAAVVVTDGEAYAFLAPSGVGKTTHTNLWLEHFGNRAFILNGDKPVIRRTDGVWRAFGTPWCGKEGLNRNTSAPLRALCFLERGSENILRETEPDELIDRLSVQLLLPKDAGSVCRLFDSLNDVMRQVIVKTLICTPDVDAVIVAYNGLHP